MLCVEIRPKEGFGGYVSTAREPTAPHDITGSVLGQRLGLSASSDPAVIGEA